MMIYRIALTALTFLALTVAAVAQDWKLYTNPTDGSSLDVPTSLFTNVEQSEEGDGVVFSSADERIRLTIYGIENTSGLTLGQVKELVAADGERDITYQRRKRNWFVLSGYEASETDDRAIFYSRLAANRNRSRFSAFELVYDESLRHTVDPVVRRLSLSLKAPRR